MKQIISEQSSNAMYGGAGASMLGYLAQIDWLSFIGIMVAIGGFIVNLYSKAKENKYNEEQHIEYMKKIKLEIKQLENSIKQNEQKHEE